MGNKFPFFDELREDLEAITQDDILFASLNFAPLEEGERVLGFSLGGTLEDLTEAARAFVLMGRFMREAFEADREGAEIPKGFSPDRWILTLKGREDMCEWLYESLIRMMALSHGIEIGTRTNINVIFDQGEFWPTVWDPPNTEEVAGEKPLAAEGKEDTGDLKPLLAISVKETFH